MNKILIVDGSLAKAHVGSFTRKDGTFVKEHDNGRQAAAPKPAAGRAAGKAPAAKKVVARKEAATAPAVKPKNEGHGFHGEAENEHLRQKHGPDEYHLRASQSDREEANAAAHKRFGEAAGKLVAGGHFDSHEKAGEYLDSRHGRHLHDAASEHGGDVSKVPWLSKDVARYKKTGGATFSG